MKKQKIQKLKKVIIRSKEFGKVLKNKVLNIELLEGRWELILKIHLENEEFFILNENQIKELFKIQKDKKVLLLDFTLGDFFNPFTNTEQGIYYYKEI